MQLLIAVALAVVLLMLRLLRPAQTAKTTISDKIGTVRAVCKSSKHNFSKELTKSITLIEGLGVEGDCHKGKTVQHRSRLHIRPPPQNLRQVHLMHSELFADLAEHSKNGKRFSVRPGDLGENITTEGVDLLRLSEGTKLHFLNPADKRVDVDMFNHRHPVVRVTGLRNPCPQIQKFQDGLQEMCLVRDADRNIVQRKAGIMSVVERGGEVHEGARIIVEEPELYVPLGCV